MPYAVHEVCLVQITMPEAPDDHRYLGDCGGWVHGMCGDAEKEGENKIHRFFPRASLPSSPRKPPRASTNSHAQHLEREDLETPRKQRQQ